MCTHHPATVIAAVAVLGALGMLSGGCSAPPSRPLIANPERLLPATDPVGEVPPAASTPEPPPSLDVLDRFNPLPFAPQCVIRGQVKRHDVTWKIRSRLDAVPVLKVRDGAVTAWLQNSTAPDKDIPNATVEVEDSSMKIRGKVAAEDLIVVATSPFVVLGSFIPDGETDRQVRKVDSDQLQIDLSFGVPHVMTTSATLPCSKAGLVRQPVGTAGLLPVPATESVISAKSKLLTRAGKFDVARLVAGRGAEVPRGVLVDSRGQDKRRVTVSIRSCGGTAFGTVSASDVLGPPKILWGSSFHCPDTGERVFIPPPSIRAPMHCSVPLPVFVRTTTLEDPIGVLKEGAHFSVDATGPETTLITVGTAPVALLGAAHFSLRTVDLRWCTQNVGAQGDGGSADSS